MYTVIKAVHSLLYRGVLTSMKYCKSSIKLELLGFNLVKCT